MILGQYPIGLSNLTTNSSNYLAQMCYVLQVNYHNEQAIEHYYAAIQTHKEGARIAIRHQHVFPEDDLNDNLTHFSAATERFRINTGVIRKKSVI